MNTPQEEPLTSLEAFSRTADALRSMQYLPGGQEALQADQPLESITEEVRLLLQRLHEMQDGLLAAVPTYEERQFGSKVMSLLKKVYRKKIKNTAKVRVVAALIEAMLEKPGVHVSKEYIARRAGCAANTVSSLKFVLRSHFCAGGYYISYTEGQQLCMVKRDEQS